MASSSPPPPVGAVTAAELRRAAGSQSLPALRAAVARSGLSARELDGLGDKNPLHMAAWKGCLANVRFLLEELQCDVNAVATGQYSYGKTPIFFALTQSRDDVVDCLLDRGARVRIVNNKGQSVLSLAASHCRPETVARIREVERNHQSHCEWVNYRLTHSDQLEYGDLDPRFLDRPLRPDDVVTDICVNPTTAQSRRGAFLRRNPERVDATLAKTRKAATSKPKRRLSVQLSEEEEKRLESTWHAIDSGVVCQESLLTLVALSGKQQRAWIASAAERIRSSISEDAIEVWFESVTALSIKEQNVLKRLYRQIKSPTLMHGGSEDAIFDSGALSNGAPKMPPCSDDIWAQAYEAVRSLSMTELEARPGPVLTSQTPLWIDAPDILETVAFRLESELVIAFDSEWSGDSTDDIVSISTLQLAVRDDSWVIDLMNTESDYKERCRTFIDHLFQSKMMLGFACKRDLHMLSNWCGHQLSGANCLDLQLLWDDCRSPPGLAACVAEFSRKPLSKHEQCSDWGRRPLTESQLAYAGLDAVVLFYLLAQKRKRMES